LDALNENKIKMIKEFQFFFQAYKSLAVGDIPPYIDKIQRDLCAILIEISNAHFESASQAIRAYSISGRQTEIESAVIHLRDVFNIAKRSIYKEKHYSHLFGIISGSEPAYRWSERIMIILYLGMIARLISRIYLFLGETQNSDNWLQECRALEPDLRKQLSSSEKCQIKATFRYTRQELSYEREVIFLYLYEIDENYLNQKYTTKQFSTASGGVHNIPRIEISISEKGRQFLLDKIIEV
jgi:hypothetical protein